MKVLGLDLSLKATGICILDGEPGASPSIVTELFAQPQVSGIEARVMRLINIAKRITSIIETERPDHIIIEAAAKNQVWQAAAIGEVHGAVKTQIYLTSGMIPMVKEATEIRKAVIGKIERSTVSYVDKKGNTKKRVSYGEIKGPKGKSRRATVKDIIEMRLSEQGLKFNTQDEMDAYVTARYCFDRISTQTLGGTNDPQKT